MQELRQSTEIKVRIGSAVDFEDGVTPETTLALGAADQAELLKHNGAATVDISGSTFAAVTAVDGWYDLTLTTSHTDTLGQLTVVIQDSSLMAPIFRDFMVVTANYWDSKYSTDVLQVDVTQWLGTAAATPTVAGVPEVDLTHWLGTGVSVNVAGKPTVDVTNIGASSQSLIDLKDFVDSGYDPATNKVQGVVLVDTTTTNTDMVGTDNAALAATALTDVTWTDAKAAFLDHAISTVDTNVDTLLTRVTAAVALASICTEGRLAELDAANLPTDIADIPTVAEFEARTIAAADYVVVGDTLAAVTTVTNLTNAPTNGDLTATMKTSVNTEAKDVLTVDTIADSYATDGNQPTIAQAILAIQQFAQEKSISGTTLTVKKPDGSTTAMTFTLDHATEPTSLTRAT